MNRKTVLLAPMVVLCLAWLFLAGCGNDTDSDVEASSSIPAVFGKGSPSPDFTLKKINGGELQLSSLHGKAVLLDFWDTWCPPCIKAMPHLQELSETYGDDLVVVGVAMGREGESKVRSFAKAHGITFEMVMFNNDMNLLKNFGGIQSIPTTFLIDDKGVVREKWVGAASKAAYEKAVLAVIGS